MTQLLSQKDMFFLYSMRTCKQKNVYRFVNNLKSGVGNVAVGYKLVRFIFNDEQEHKYADYLLKCGSIWYGTGIQYI